MSLAILFFWRFRMKANQVKVGTKVSYKNTHLDHYTGIIICNSVRIGDEFVIVEWDNDFAIDVMDINRLNIIQ